MRVIVRLSRPPVVATRLLLLGGADWAFWIGALSMIALEVSMLVLGGHLPLRP